MASGLSAKGLEKLDALRKQRAYDPMRLTGENKPDIAYFNMGHGGEYNNENEMKTMPKGCIFVLKAKPGRLSAFDKSLLKERLCEPKNQSLFLDPIKNYKRLNDMFDTRPDTVYKISGETATSKTSLAIYREYDNYPETLSALLNVIPSVEFNAETGESEHSYYQSGFLNSSDLSNCRKRSEKPLKNKKLTINFIVSLFEGSFFPGPDYVRKILNAGIKKNSYKGKPLWYKIHSIIKTDKYTTIKQSEIFKMVEKGAHGFKPGVYYNLACRYTGGDFLKKDLTNVNEKSLEPIRKDGKIAFNPEIGKQIAEAEGHRRNLISRLKLDNKEGVSLDNRNYRLNHDSLKGLSNNERTKKYYNLKASQNARKMNNTRKIKSYYNTHTASSSIGIDEPATKYKKTKNGKWVINNTPIPLVNDPLEDPSANNPSANNPSANVSSTNNPSLKMTLKSKINNKSRIQDIIKIIDELIIKIDTKIAKVGGTRKNRLRNKRRTLRKLVY